MKLLGPCLAAGLLALAGTAHATPALQSTPTVTAPACGTSGLDCPVEERGVYRRM